jgi:hypothetical protein
MASRATPGSVLVRGLVPLWLLAGALFKLVEASPRTLPQATILAPANRLGVDLHVLLAGLVALELLGVGLMAFARRLARPVAVAILSAFCLILLNEMRAGSGSCGCFGSLSPPLPLMLAIDGALLLGVLFLAPGGAAGEPLLEPRSIAAALGFAAVGALASFLIIIRPAGGGGADPLSTGPIPPTGTAAATDDPSRNPAPEPVRRGWMAPDLAQWIGQPWRAIDLFRFMPRWPSQLDRGKRYIIFYRRTCDHCLALFRELEVVPLDAPVTAVDVPETATEREGPGAWPLPEGLRFELRELPLGCEWMITTPLVVAVEEGVVTCAQEGNGDFRRCLGLQ